MMLMHYFTFLEHTVIKTILIFLSMDSIIFVSFHQSKLLSQFWVMFFLFIGMPGIVNFNLLGTEYAFEFSPSGTRLRFLYPACPFKGCLQVLLGRTTAVFHFVFLPPRQCSWRTPSQEPNALLSSHSAWWEQRFLQSCVNIQGSCICCAFGVILCLTSRSFLTSCSDR